MRSRTGTTGACEALIMTIKIDRKIVKYQVQKPEDQPPDKAVDKAAARASEARAADKAAEKAAESELVRDKNGHTAKVIRMHERLERPEVLIGSTYKIKTPISDHAMYVTINDIVLTRAPSTSSAARSRFSSTPRTSITSSGSWRSRASSRRCSAKAATSPSWWMS